MRKLNVRKIFENEINEHISSIDFFLKNHFDEFNNFLNLVIKTLKKGNKIILFGNGGSASDAQHIATELVVKYKKKRRSIPAISLSTDTSALIAIGITTSGKILNLINALKLSKKKKIKSIILTKQKCPNRKQIEKFSDFILGGPAEETSRIQELHILVGHLMCAVIDEVF